MTEIEIIKKSNTIFSTMVCPECGKPMKFLSYDSNKENKIYAFCDDCGGFNRYYSTSEICFLLNNNEINCLVRDSVETSEKAVNGFFNK